MITEIRGRKLRPLISAADIKTKVGEMGKRIAEDYRDKKPVFIGILKGGFIFLADLVREVDFNVEIDFVKASSYKEGMEPGEIELVTDVTTPLKGRHVLLVEDMLDTGITLHFLKSVILSKEPASLKLCALIDKKERRQIDIEADYTGFDIGEGFIVGYGTDCGEMGRNLPGVYVLE
ncbi:MAG TPA: hypoxanthine phosphoribosyltransferase [Thermodesulfobacteriota bacterium]|nr:hypoxanthine phosphoribosyltransferase [Thermodesulfobacteriota bacterium]